MSKSISSTGYFYTRAGPLQTVLKKSTQTLTVGANQVVVQVSAAPLHRTDAAIINGTALGRLRPGDALYKTFPRLGGVEGVGRVVEAGPEARRVKVGDFVWMAPLQGSWADKVVANDNLCHVIKPEQASLAQFAACLITAQQLLSGFGKLDKSSVVVQNGGSSLVSLAVSALAREEGITVFTTASPGSRFEKAAARHKTYGSQVFENTPAGLRKLREATGKNQPRLVLNGVGGPLVNELIKSAARGATVVTFGAQHGFGLSWAGSHHYFNDVKHKGFFLPTHIRNAAYEERQAQLDFVLERATKAKLSYPTEVAASLDALPAVWDKMYVDGGVKGLLTLSGSK